MFNEGEIVLEEMNMLWLHAKYFNCKMLAWFFGVTFFYHSVCTFTYFLFHVVFVAKKYGGVGWFRLKLAAWKNTWLSQFLRYGWEYLLNFIFLPFLFHLLAGLSENSHCSHAVAYSSHSIEPLLNFRIVFHQLSKLQTEK